MDTVQSAITEMAELERRMQGMQTQITLLHHQMMESRERFEKLRQFTQMAEELFGTKTDVTDDKGQEARAHSLAERLETLRVALRRENERLAESAGASTPAAQLVDILARNSLRQRRSTRRIASAVAEIIRAHGPKGTRELVQLLEDRGEQLSGEGIADKVSALSVILSRDDQFESDRARGWSLKVPSEGENPASAGTPAGSSEGSETLPVQGGSGAATGLTQLGGRKDD